MLPTGMRDANRRRASRTIAAALVVIAALTMLGGSTADARRVSPRHASDAYASRIFALINAERRRQGLPRLHLSSCARVYANRWSAQLAHRQKLQHQSLKPLQKSCTASRVAENIGYGNITADALMKKWMSSSRHRKNISSPRLSSVGIGAARSKSGDWYAVQDFLGF
jgi:uncharacterized protein YkwD